MTTATILIGNSDNKLTQQEWADFCTAATEVVAVFSSSVQFSGTSAGDKPWQNACWVITTSGDYLDDIRAQLARIARIWRQDAIALVVGETEFVEARQ